MQRGAVAMKGDYSVYVGRTFARCVRTIPMHTCDVYIRCGFVPGHMVHKNKVNIQCP